MERVGKSCGDATLLYWSGLVTGTRPTQSSWTAPPGRWRRGRHRRRARRPRRRGEQRRRRPRPRGRQGGSPPNRTPPGRGSGRSEGATDDFDGRRPWPRSAAWPVGSDPARRRAGPSTGRPAGSRAASPGSATPRAASASPSRPGCVGGGGAGRTVGERRRDVGRIDPGGAAPRRRRPPRHGGAGAGGRGQRVGDRGDARGGRGRVGVGLPRLPVVFVAFGAEEPRGPGDEEHHFGSRTYVAALGPAERRAVRGDGLPRSRRCRRPGAGGLRGRLRPGAAQPARGRVVGRASRPSRTRTRGAATTGRSCAAGMPGARLGSTSYAAYHDASDVPSVVSPAQLERTGRLLAGVARAALTAQGRSPEHARSDSRSARKAVASRDVRRGCQPVGTDALRQPRGAYDVGRPRAVRRTGSDGEGEDPGARVVGTTGSTRRSCPGHRRHSRGRAGRRPVAGVRACRRRCRRPAPTGSGPATAGRWLGHELPGIPQWM